METATFQSPQSYPVAPSPLPLSPDPSADRPLEPLEPMPMADLDLPAADPAEAPAAEGEEPVNGYKGAPDVAALEISAATPPQEDIDAGEGHSPPPGPSGLPPPPPKPLKTALSRAAVGEGGSRLAASKRTVSWADLTNTGTLTQVKEYQPESAPGSPLSDASWEADHGAKGCCTLM